MLLPYAAQPFITIIEMAARPKSAPTVGYVHLMLKGGKRCECCLEYRFPWKPEMPPPRLARWVTIEKILADLKPEAAYFFADDDGNRSGSIVFDMKDSSQIPAVAEPWFLAFNAKVSFRPVMNPQDLATAGPSITKAGQQYGK